MGTKTGSHFECGMLDIFTFCLIILRERSLIMEEELAVAGVGATKCYTIIGVMKVCSHPRVEVLNVLGVKIHRRYINCKNRGAPKILLWLIRG